MEANPSTQYATDSNLAARQRLWATGVREPAFDLFPWVLDLAGIGANAESRVLDVGCGNGKYETVKHERGHRGPCVALDLSLGMLEHVANARPLLADVQHLPLADASFDVVLAPHMLYHVPDLIAGVGELRRVLRADGVCIAVTNGVRNLAELRELVETAVGTGWKMGRPADVHFKLENGADSLSGAFRTVERVDCPPTTVVVTDLDALTDYVASTGDHYEAEVGRPWSEVVARVRELAAAQLEADGAIRFTSAVGAFVCR